jgi:peptidoglycan/LPS O-acetylase OafA/YrhL
LPIFDGPGFWGTRIEMFIGGFMNSQAGVLGVSLFFIVTGYLMPMMLERYSRLEFLANRFFRIVPALAAALAVVGLFSYVAFGLTFTPNTYLGSLTLTYLFVGVVPVNRHPVDTGCGGGVLSAVGRTRALQQAPS